MHGDRQRSSRLPPRRSKHVFELLVLVAFMSIVAFCAYDGFKEIFAKAPEFKPKLAEDSIAELKASIAKAREGGANTHKYVKAAKGERRSALSTDTPPPPQHVYVLEPVIQEEEAREPPQYSKVVVVSAMQEAPCVTDGGDELHYLSVLNKQDYARLHGYDFVLGIKQVDPQLENMWNKPAWLLKVLEDEARQGEWILWVDIDTVILDANFTLPYDDLAARSKDLVVYGNLTQVQAGHPVKALNTGVMLVRNTPWARHFFSEVNRLGRLDDHHKGKNTLSAVLLKELQADAYSDGLRDQNAVIYLLKTHPEWHDRVAFMDKEVCLNCYWRDLIGVTGYGKPDYERNEEVSFVQHFMGCQTCNAQNRNGDLDSCREGMFHSFKYARSHQQPMLQGARPRSEGDLAQLRELPYCSINPSAEGCKGAKPLDTSLLASASSPVMDWKAVDNAIVTGIVSTFKEGESQGSEGMAGSALVQQPQATSTLKQDSSFALQQADGGSGAQMLAEVPAVATDSGGGAEEDRTASLGDGLTDAEQQVERRETMAIGQRKTHHRKHARLSQGGSNQGGKLHDPATP